VDNLSVEQPVWPIVFDSIKALAKVRQVLDWKPKRVVAFVVDARAALSQTNLSVSLWPEHSNNSGNVHLDIKRSLIKAHKEDQKWKLEITNPSIMDYVNTAVKPSLLNDLGTLFYKISNYQQRKDIQKICIGYLAGLVGKVRMVNTLKANLKFGPILQLMISDQAEHLRHAVAELKTDTVDRVAKRTGFATFELLYVQRSAANNGT
jgi:hypothetical protein